MEREGRKNCRALLLSRFYSFFFAPLLILLSVFINCTDLEKDVPIPKARQGSIELIHRDFDYFEEMKLEGEWEFYWKEFIIPSGMEKVRNPVYGKVPSTWSDYEDTNKTDIGFATFRLNLKLREKSIYSLYIPAISSAYTIFINGNKQSSVGSPGADENSTVPSYAINSITFYSGDGNVDLVLFVSNFHHREGGISKSIYIGSPEQIKWRFFKDILFDFAIIASLSIIGLYHLIIFYFRKQDLSSLYFSVLSFVLIFRVAFSGSYLITYIVPSFPWELLRKLEYYTFAYIAYFMVMYFYRLFPMDYNRNVNKILLTISTLYSIFVTFNRSIVYTNTVAFFQVIYILVILYIFSGIIKAIKKDRKGSVLLCIVSIILAVTVINDILYSRDMLAFGYLGHLGLVIFFMGQSVILATRHSESYNLSEELRRELSFMVAEISSKNHELVKSKDRIETLFVSSRELVGLSNIDATLNFGARQIIKTMNWNSQNDVIVYNLDAESDEKINAYQIIKNNFDIEPFLAVSLTPVEVKFYKDVKAILNTGNELIFPIKAKYSFYVIRITHNSGYFIDKEDLHFLEAMSNLLGLILSNQYYFEKEKLTYLGQMTAGIIHDLKNPMTVVKLYSELAANDTYSREKQKGFLDKVIREIDFITDLTNDILDVMRGTITLHLEVIGIEKYFLQIKDTLNDMLLNKDITLEYAFAVDATIKLDKDRFRRVIFNIAKNAAEAMPSGGVFRISTFLKEDRIFIELSDTGIGIDESVKSKIFKMFVSHGKQSGTGLGLAIAKKIIQEHGWSISFRSEKGKGTVFTIAIPEKAGVIEIQTG